MSEEILAGNVISNVPDLGLSLCVFDHRPETLKFMEKNALQGGGPTWVGLITAALLLESPKTLSAISFDDEGDEVLITSKSSAALNVVQSYVSILMTDSEFMESCIAKARQGGYLE
jgi:hypothetical protein